MLESFSVFQTLSPLLERALLPESATWECGGRAAVSRPGLGAELRIMWERLLKFFLLILEI